MNFDLQQKELVSTARITGICYLALAITGMVGFMVLHPRIYVSDDPARTLANITEFTTLARLRLLFELLIVASQALAAVWFYKLFRDIEHAAAWMLASWGMVNAVLITISAMAMGAAIETAAGAQAMNDKVIMIQILQLIIRHAWGIGGLFFGLWLIPMGYIVIRSQRMPVWLGRVLILGGVGYILSTFISYMGVKESWVGMLPIPATIGELWMIAYLLIYGIRPAKE